MVIIKILFILGLFKKKASMPYKERVVIRDGPDQNGEAELVRRERESRGMFGCCNKEQGGVNVVQSLKIY